jgi:uroporphyrinogen decarboxylase
MDPAELKREFGKHLSFWGGIDTHRLLPQGSPEEVSEEVRRIVRILGRDGGYVLNPVHNIQPDVPPENIVAMYDAILDV